MRRGPVGNAYSFLYYDISIKPTKLLSLLGLGIVPSMCLYYFQILVALIYVIILSKKTLCIVGIEIQSI